MSDLIRGPTLRVDSCRAARRLSRTLLFAGMAFVSRRQLVVTMTTLTAGSGPGGTPVDRCSGVGTSGKRP